MSGLEKEGNNLSKDIGSYSKHQKSRHKRFVITDNDGKKYSGNTQEEAEAKLPPNLKTKGFAPVIPKKVESTPKYDPSTGEQIN